MAAPMRSAATPHRNQRHHLVDQPGLPRGTDPLDHSARRPRRALRNQNPPRLDGQRPGLEAKEASPVKSLRPQQKPRTTPRGGGRVQHLESEGTCEQEKGASTYKMKLFWMSDIDPSEARSDTTAGPAPKGTHGLVRSAQVCGRGNEIVRPITELSVLEEVLCEQPQD